MSELREQLLNRADTYFQNGYYCSEAILKAYNELRDLGLNDAGLKMATTFAAGFGGAKCTCGSLTGAQLALGALTGRTSNTTPTDAAFAPAKRLHDGFKEQYGAICCRTLTRKLDWGTPGHHEHCRRFVRGAVELLEDILEEHDASLRTPS